MPISGRLSLWQPNMEHPLRFVDLLIKNGAQLDEINALSTAVENGQADMVNFRLDRDAKIHELGFVYCGKSGGKWTTQEALCISP